MAKIKLEYIWLDGYEPTQNLRSKTKVEDHDNFIKVVNESYKLIAECFDYFLNKIRGDQNVN
jgi:hypothetical protein